MSTEYIERGALIEKLKEKITTNYLSLYDEDTLESIIRFAEKQPAADVEPVVRCKDCVKWGMRDCKRNPCAIDISSMDEFCSDGERKAHMDERSDT